MNQKAVLYLAKRFSQLFCIEVEHRKTVVSDFSNEGHNVFRNSCGTYNLIKIIADNLI